MNPSQAPTGAMDFDGTAPPSSLAAKLNELPVVETSTALTCVLILLTGPREWYVAVFTTGLAAAALVFQALRKNKSVWVFLATAVLTASLTSWHDSDNHKYLLAYWCLALALAYATREPEATIASAARWLIGSAFAFAVYWKLRTPDFLSGDFFRLQLMIDSRFASVTSWLGGVPLEDLTDFRRLWAALDDVSHLAEFGGMDYGLPKRVHVLAKLLAWWTVFIEGAIALAFFAPERSLVGRHRDTALLAFVGTTYAVATVLGFGFLLLAMGLCQARGPRMRAAYVALFLILFLFQIPVFGLAGNLVDGDAP